MPDRDASLRNRAAFHNGHAFKLGLFGANCSSGRSVTRAPERWSGNWDDNLRLAQMADAAGIDFLLPIGRWLGFGGDSDFEGATLESITWALAVLAKTENISAFATVHVPLIHPIVAAKQIVTADLVAKGRFGLNIVCGWNQDEFEMFGVTQRDHETRYEYAQEWIDAVKTMWGSERETFDFDGEFIKLSGVRARPKPYGDTRPVIMNAGMSPVGQAFAIRNCDALFTSLGRSTFDEMADHISKVKATAREGGRDMDVYTTGIIACRPTMQEARDYYEYAVFEMADWNAIENIMRMQGVPLDTLSPGEREAQRRKWAIGFGGHPMVGDPDFVAGELARIAALGIRGIAVSMVNFIDELPLIVDEVLPRLERMGLRAKR